MTAVVHQSGSHGPITLTVFGRVFRFAWIAVVLLTVISELVFFPNTPATLFYSYKAAKVLLFVLLGYLTPLTFWRFNSVTLGLIFGTFSAMLVESAQAAGISSGHSFSWLELGAKLCLVFVGFALALDARYERRIKLGSFRIALIDPVLGL
jgi:hypothetical protein